MIIERAHTSYSSIKESKISNLNSSNKKSHMIRVHVQITQNLNANLKK